MRLIFNYVLPVIILVCIGITFYWKFNDPGKLILIRDILPYSNTNNVVMAEDQTMWIEIDGMWFQLMAN